MRLSIGRAGGGRYVAALLCATLLGATGLAHATSQTAQARLAGERPNIVVVMLDDLKYEPTELLLRRMPTLRRIFLRDSLQFDRYYGNDPLCCPGRAAFLTGLYSHHHGVTDNDARMFDARGSLAVRLRQAGYWTVMAGKYLNGYHRLANKMLPGWDRAAVTNGHFTRAEGLKVWVDGTRSRAFPPYQADVVGSEIVAGARLAPGSKPIFAWLSFYAPHKQGKSLFPTPAPRHVDAPACAGIGHSASPAYNEPDVSDKPLYLRAQPALSEWPAGWPLTTACESLLSVDEAVAALQRQLASQGRLDDTLWVLTGDNGMGWGEHRVVFKRKPYSTQLPLYIAGPGLRTGLVSEYLSNVDLGPTLAEIGGTKLGPFPWYTGRADGISFAGLLRGQPWRQPRSALLEEQRAGDRMDGMPPWWALRTTNGRWHYVEDDNGERELYDLQADPWELNNLARAPATKQIRAELSELLRQLRKAGGGGGTGGGGNVPRGDGGASGQGSTQPRALSGGRPKLL